MNKYLKIGVIALALCSALFSHNASAENEPLNEEILLQLIKTPLSENIEVVRSRAEKGLKLRLSWSWGTLIYSAAK